ncbi:MAG: glycosyltransferase family 2 protein [Clostridiales Family XIII bacterium]|jgi:glycosyltransferase involved in cell wall biosynthesis|nr:glycosyltransferase family 2 protein [Clostridiales Family XIII bacterium]
MIQKPHIPPLISIIIPVYNAEKYLRKCVESVTGQTYENLEVILVDDGSADGSGSLCDALAREDERIVVIHKENGGVSSARNAGLEAARGDYITFLDCDDYIEGEMYQTLMELAAEHDADITIGTIYEEQSDGSVVKIDTGAQTLMTGEEATAAILGCVPQRTNHKMFVWFFVWNKLYRSSILKDVKFDPETDSAEDVPFNLRAFSRAEKVLYIERPFNFWRHRAVSLSNAHSVKALRGGAATSLIMSRYASALPDSCKRDAITSSFRNIYWYYTACIPEIRRAKSSGHDFETYREAQRHMRKVMQEMKREKAYPYLARRFKLAVFFMLHLPGIFDPVWMLYRKIKRRLS